MSQIYLLFPLFATLCAGLIFAVLFKSNAQKTQAAAIAFIIPAMAVGVYIWIGNPFVPGASALLETTGPNFERRQMALKEQEILSTMAESQTALTPSTYIDLADIQIEQGKTDQAIATLKQAARQFSADPPAQNSINDTLGYAYYIQGLTYKIEEERKKAVKALETARDIAPDQVKYRSDLLKDIKRLK